MQHIGRISDHRVLPARRYSKFQLFFLVSFGCASSALIAEQAYVASYEGFGGDDIWAFAFWLAPLSVVVGIVALALAMLRCSLFRLTTSIIAGLVGGYIWTRFVHSALGPWFGAFSLPVLYFWMLGAVVGLGCGSVYVSYFGTDMGKGLAGEATPSPAILGDAEKNPAEKKSL